MRKGPIIAVAAGCLVFVGGAVLLVVWLLSGSTESPGRPGAAPESTPGAGFESGVTVVTADQEMAAFFAEAPRGEAPPLPAIEALAGNWKGRVDSVDLDEGIGAQPVEWPEVAFSIEGKRFLPENGLGAERTLSRGTGEYLATAPNLPDLHLRLQGDRLVGWAESTGEPKGRMEFHATRTR